MVPVMERMRARGRSSVVGSIDGHGCSLRVGAGERRRCDRGIDRDGGGVRVRGVLIHERRRRVCTNIVGTEQGSHAWSLSRRTSSSL